MKKIRAIIETQHRSDGLFFLYSVFFFSALLVYACAVAPDEETVKSSIVHYFEARNYKVVRLEVADIKPVPLNRKVYMGTAGYIVNIKLIALEAFRDAAKQGRGGEGALLTFKDAVILIRERAGERGRWEISVISGIPIL